MDYHITNSFHSSRIKTDIYDLMISIQPYEGDNYLFIHHVVCKSIDTALHRESHRAITYFSLSL